VCTDNDDPEGDIICTGKHLSVLRCHASFSAVLAVVQHPLDPTTNYYLTNQATS